MNVVYDTVKSLNGSIQIQNEIGKGICFKLSFPLTLAIVPAIIIIYRIDYLTLDV